MIHKGKEPKMAHDLMYIELKTGYSDDGPAWIGYVKASKSGKTLYFNDHAFRKRQRDIFQLQRY